MSSLSDAQLIALAFTTSLTIWGLAYMAVARVFDRHQ